MLASASLAVSPTETLTRADPLGLGVALTAARATTLLAGVLLAVDFFGAALLTARFGAEVFAGFLEAGATAFLFDFFAFLAI
jgi:hypothetical protein